MNKLSVIFSLVTLLGACSINYYGHTKEVWDKLTPEKQAKTKENIKILNEQQHTRDLINKIIDNVLGSRSDKY